MNPTQEQELKALMCPDGCGEELPTVEIDGFTMHDIPNAQKAVWRVLCGSNPAVIAKVNEWLEAARRERARSEAA